MLRYDKEYHLAQGIDLDNTKIVWKCEECGHKWDDEGYTDDDICPNCESGNTIHEHISIKRCIDCGIEFTSTYQKTDLCNDCFNLMVDSINE